MTDAAPARTRLPRGARLLIGLVFVVTMLANLPASFLRIALDQADGDFVYQSVDGKLWRGVVRGVRVGEINIGDVDYTLRLSAFLTGALKADFRTEGGSMRADGRLSYGVLSKTLDVSDANIDFDLSAIRRYTFYGLPYQGRARAVIERLKVASSRCEIAKADLWTDIMTSHAKRLSGEPLDLSGAAGCTDDNKLKVVLSGGSGSGDLIFEATISPDMSFALAARVTPRRTDLQDALTLLGFERKGDAYTYDAVGEIKGLTS